MDYFFRMPEFPVLVDTGDQLISARSWEECEARLNALSLSGSKPLPVIDATAEGFSFYPDLNVVSPLSITKSWTKAQIVALYNARRRPGAPTYAPKLPSRTLARIISDVADLLSDAPAADAEHRRPSPG